MHRTSHWLGMDVHDVGVYKLERRAARRSSPAWCSPSSPASTSPTHLDDVAPQWRGIGIRIEDDVLVTADGHEVLTAAVPKAVAEIEAIRRRERSEPRAA